MNLTVLVFSKDRPLQLRAYLESLMHYSGIPQSCITVLYKECPPILYDRLIAMFPEVVWWKETDFRTDLREIVDGARDHILWGCDDVVYLGEWDPQRCMDMFAEHFEVFSVGLRYGLDKKGALTQRYDAEMLKEYGLLETWRQAWELGCSLYRKSDVETVLAHRPNPKFTIDYKPVQLQGETIGEAVLMPNYLEALGSRNLGWLPTARQHMAIYPNARAILFAVNLVQTVFRNFSNGCSSLKPDKLYQAFLEGKALDWRRLHNWHTEPMHVRGEEFHVE